MLEFNELSEIHSFFYSFNCEAQQVIKKARRGAEKAEQAGAEKVNSCHISIHSIASCGAKKV